MADDKYFRAGLNAIDGDKVDTLRKLITFLKLKDLPEKDRVSRVIPWIEFCYEKKRDLCLISILIDLQIALYLFVNREVSVPILRMVVKLLKLNFLEVLSNVPDDTLPTYARIEFTFFHCPLIKDDLDPMTLEMMEKLEQSFDATKPGLNSYLIKRLDELREFSLAPKWIIPHENPFIKEEELMRVDYPDPNFDFPSELEEQADYVLKDIEMKPEERQLAKEGLLREWNNFDDLAGQSQFVMDIYKASFRPKTREEVDCIRTWGPINPIPDEVEDKESCYMFGHYSNWFTGICETCGIKIPEFYYAIRAPVRTGGWAGCYCSLKCAGSEEVDIDDEDLERIGKELHDFGIFFREGG